jgi:hypothetical protein
MDVLRVQDAGLQSADDPAVLAWAANEGRVLASHDVSTLTAYAYARVRAGQSMPGLIEAGPDVPRKAAIEDLFLIAECSLPGEWEPGLLRSAPQPRQLAMNSGALSQPTACCEGAAGVGLRCCPRVVTKELRRGYGGVTVELRWDKGVLTGF